MQLPHAERAIIAPEKVRDYLLSPAHPVGRYKAVFFRAAGYAQADWARLATDIRGLLAWPVARVETTPFGVKYVVSGELVGPSGLQFRLTSVWIILSDAEALRLVTAYPED